MTLEVIAAFFAALSFGILFNIKGKYLIIAAIGGGLGWFIYKLCLYYSVGNSISLFVSSISFSIYCEVCARLYKTPSTVLSVCCLIPLVPGYGVYNTLYEFFLGDYIKSVDYAIDTLLSSVALALGIIFISTLFRNFNLRKVYKDQVLK